ncbi:MAG: ATP-dependent DNA helicase [Candidatus Nomurabacteria bacterium]|nr:ATP-dependent DNA helicase [Candidatus Nomurabacteria bacterium]
MFEDTFTIQYKKLNKAQKDAVESIDGQVMVVAGPGTGKTQVLALRIGHILKETDTKADSILCLTFTNSGVKAMKKRLEEYIGTDANNVKISTFHAFAIKLVEDNYELLDFKRMPKLLEDDEAVFLADEIMQNNTWEYLRPRSNPTMYFNDLKSLISVLKRERLTPEEFLKEVEHDIKFYKNDPDSISTRGESKGKLKKEIEKKIESLERTREVVEFYRIYEERKREENLMDYDDVLEYAVKLVEEYEDVRADVKEEYLYVLVDEHQDSSGVQNNFLKAVWKDTEKPNIFVVGDDRQLIYAFSGAKLSYFEEFAHFFGKAKLIILTENYRSTASILALADNLLGSSITKEKLNSNTKGEDKILLNEYSYPRDEIIGAGLYFKNKIVASTGSEKMKPEDCAILVPKNFHVRTAIQILGDMGLPVSTGKSMSLFNVKETYSFLRVLNIITEPFNSVFLSESLLDNTSGVKPFESHKFLKTLKPDRMTIDDLINNGGGDGLFAGENDISKWGKNLKAWTELANGKLSIVVSKIGNELLIDNSKTHSELLKNVEVVRSFIHTAMIFEQKHNNANLKDFIEYFKRLENYGNHITLATFESDNGIQVMTLHKSKGLEYKNVWIAHMNEEVLMSEKRNGFTLPEKVKEHIHERDIENAKRELYVAITRAKENCVISYANESYNGAQMELAQIIRELPQETHFIKKEKEETEKEIMAGESGVKIYTSVVEKKEGKIINEIKDFARENYKNTKVTVTLLNNFFECPWKWYFRNFLKLPEVKGTSLALGSAVHSTIEFILKNKELPSDKIIKEKINESLNKEGVQDEKEIKTLAKDAEKAIKNWIDGYYANLSKDYSSERSVQFTDPKYPDLLMYGKLDLTERENGNITVTDFKTGKPKTKSEIEKIDEEGRLSGYMRQLTMYSYLVAGAERGKSVESSRLLFLEAKEDDKNALYSIHIDEEKIDLLKRDIKDYVESIESGKWVDIECHYKPWGSSKDECEYCILANKIII